MNSVIITRIGLIANQQSRVCPAWSSVCHHAIRPLVPVPLAALGASSVSRSPATAPAATRLCRPTVVFCASRQRAVRFEPALKPSMNEASSNGPKFLDIGFGSRLCVPTTAPSNGSSTFGAAVSTSTDACGSSGSAGGACGAACGGCFGAARSASHRSPQIRHTGGVDVLIERSLRATRITVDLAPEA